MARSQAAVLPGRAGHGWYALAGVDVEAPAGPSRLKVFVRSAGTVRDLSREVEIHSAHYRTGSLTVAPKFVEPAPEALKQIEEERILKDQVFGSSAPEPYWTVSFHAPVAAPSTASFGTRRMFNGKLASIHKGMDFRAAAGTPVHAGNRDAGSRRKRWVWWCWPGRSITKAIAW